MKLAPIITIWAAVVVTAWMVFEAFVVDVAGNRNVNADGAHLRSFYAMFWLIVLCAELFVAFLLMSGVKNLSVRASFGVLIGFVAVALGIERAYVAANPQPTQYLVQMRGTYYAVPRAFSPRRAGDDVTRGRMYLTVCNADKKPIGLRETCPRLDTGARRGPLSISGGAITEQYWVSEISKRLKLPYNGDVLGDVPADVGQSEDGVLVFKDGGSVLMLELAADRKINRAVWCREASTMCNGYSQTEFGMMQFQTPGPSEVDRARWDADQARYEGLFAGWRCEEATCGGVFMGGATEAFE